MEHAEPELVSVWERLTHHEIKVVFEHRRPPGGCVARRVRPRRRHGRVDCTNPWVDGPLDDVWPDAPGYPQPGDGAADLD